MCFPMVKKNRKEKHVDDLSCMAELLYTLLELFDEILKYQATLWLGNLMINIFLFLSYALFGHLSHLVFC